MAVANEFLEAFYVREFLTNYAGLLANLADGLEEESKKNIGSLISLDKKAKNLLTNVNYIKYKKKKSQLTKTFNQKLLEKVDKEIIEDPINSALKSLKKYNI